MNLPPSSLIIPTRGRPNMLLDTVESVLKGSALPTEIVIVDQSEQQNPGLANSSPSRACAIRYIHSQSIGVSRARNEGLRAAAHDLLVLIDDDMLAPPDWYAALVEALVEVGPGSVVTGRVLPGPAEQPGGFVPALVESPQPRTYAGRIGTDVLAGCHMAMFRQAFQRVGGFDERLGPGARLPAAEDNDYGFRLLEAGFQIVYVPQAVIYHRAWRGEKEYRRLRWNYGRGKGAYYTKYASLRDPYLLNRMVKDILTRLVRFPWRILHRPTLALGDLIYTAGILSGSIDWLRADTKQAALKAPAGTTHQPKATR